MWEDPIVKEVREARMEIERECDGDFRKIYEYALKIQKEIVEERTSEKKAQNEKLPLAA